MKRDDPILIAGPPRSGTTMMAGLLYHHGVWVGNARTTNHPGTNPSDFGSENLDIKELMKSEAKRIGYKNWKVPLPDDVELRPDLKDRIDEIVPNDLQWLVKTSWTLIFYRFWRKAYPRARWLIVRRPIPMIMDSMQRHPAMRKRHPDERLAFIKALHNRQLETIRTLESEDDFFTVDVEKIAVRDKLECERLFEYLRIPINWEAINRWIKPSDFKIA